MVATATRPAERKTEDGGDLQSLLNKPTGYDRPELLQLKMENETIMAECRLHPRDFDSIKADLLEQLQAFPELATDAIYHKPVGKDQNGNEKFATGLSVRAAEALAEAYGYNRIRSDVSELDADKVKVEATFTDYQKGRVWQDAGILSKTYKDRYGKPARWNDDRFYNVVVKAEVSKRVREVIMRSVNTGLKAWFENECDKISAGLLDDKTINKILDQYASKSVTLEMLEGLVGRPRAMGWTQVDRQRLLGVWNAIRDGETSVAEAFGDKATKPLPEPSKNAPKLPDAPAEPEAIAKARNLFGSINDPTELDYEADQLVSGQDESTVAAIRGLQRDRKVALIQPKGKAKQGELVK